MIKAKGAEKTVPFPPRPEERGFSGTLIIMLETTANTLRKNLRQEVQRCVASHEVLRVRQQGGDDFVILSVADWRAIEETLYLNQISGMVTSIHAAAAEPLMQGTRLEDLDW